MDPIETVFSLAALKQAGAFTGEPVKRTITWSIAGKKLSAVVYVRRLSYHAAVGEVASFIAKKDGVAARIASSIVDENNKPIFSVGDITGEADPARGPLDYDLTMNLFNLIGEINSLGKKSGSTS